MAKKAYNVWLVKQKSWTSFSFNNIGNIDFTSQDINNPERLTRGQAQRLKEYIKKSYPSFKYKIKEIVSVCNQDCCINGI